MALTKLSTLVGFAFLYVFLLLARLVQFFQKKREEQLEETRRCRKVLKEVARKNSGSMRVTMGGGRRGRARKKT